MCVTMVLYRVFHKVSSFKNAINQPKSKKNSYLISFNIYFNLIRKNAIKHMSTSTFSPGNYLIVEINITLPQMSLSISKITH